MNKYYVKISYHIYKKIKKQGIENTIRKDKWDINLVKAKTRTMAVAEEMQFILKKEKNIYIDCIKVYKEK